ncbi:MAG TPA: vitamin K epoxide reductase family protein [Leptolyngbyaceae cyanobacterium]
MVRRRQETSWIHRWSRYLIAGIAFLGILETSYLTFVKLTGGTAVCPTEGCDRVLNSPYASVFGLPLTLFGGLAYLTMFILAVLPLTANAETKLERRQQLEAQTWPVMFGFALAMVICSSYLMYIMAFEIQALCPYCITSALFTVTMLALILFGNRWKDVGQLLFTGIIIGVITLTGVLALYAPLRASSGGGGPVAQAGEVGPPITTTSGPAEIALAQHLKSIGAKMYAAWWCPHCHDQKQMFGAEAMAQVPYVECASDGRNAQPQLCGAVTGFPTWEIKGQMYPGVQSLQKLAELSGYVGPTTFQSK